MAQIAVTYLYYLTDAHICVFIIFVKKKKNHILHASYGICFGYHLFLQNVAQAKSYFTSYRICFGGGLEY